MIEFSLTMFGIRWDRLKVFMERKSDETKGRIYKPHLSQALLSWACKVKFKPGFAQLSLSRALPSWAYKAERKPSRILPS